MQKKKQIIIRLEETLRRIYPSRYKGLLLTEIWENYVKQNKWKLKDSLKESLK